MRVLLFDCQDSFTYNLAQLTERLLGSEDSLDVVRNDALDLGTAGSYDRILLSPGPGVPSETANLLGLIRRYSGKIPILGVCLGHQALAQVFGARLLNLKRVFHGIRSTIRLLKADGIFQGLPSEIEGGRYHSWVVDEEGFPGDLEVTARDQGGLVMGFSHRELKLHGVQFHPESILTPTGPRIVENFLLGA
jgi:anthranilate synthase component 2